MQLPEVNNTKEEAEKEKFWPRHLLLFPTTSKPMKLSWKIWSTFNSRVRTKTTMVKRNSDLFLLLFSKTESIRRRRSRREIALNGIHSRGPFTTLCYASRSWMNCEAQQAQKSLFGTWWDNRTNLVKWFFFFSIGISNVTSVVTTARARCSESKMTW